MMKLEEFHARLPFVARCVLAVVFVVVGVAARFAILPAEAGLAYLTFYPVLIASFYLGGTCAGILAAILSAFTADYFFMPPLHTFTFTSDRIVSAAFFLLISAMIGWVVRNMQLALEKSRRAEEAFKHEYERDLAFIHNASDGIHILDENGNVIEASDSFCAMLGYTRREVIGMHVSQWDAGFDAPEELTKHFESQFRQKSRVQFETRHRRKDGTIFDVEVSGYPLELNGKNVVFNSSRDITARLQAEKRLFDSELRYRTLSSGTFEGVAVTADGRYIDANEQLLSIFGYTHEELVGKTVAETIMPEYREKAIAAINRGGEVRQELGMLRKDGSAVMIEAHGQPLAMDGQSSRIVAMRDMTELRAKEALIRKWADAFNHAALGIGVGDPATHRMMEVNPAFAKMLGCAVEELRGLPILELYPESEWELVRQQTAAAFERDYARFESYYQRKDGTVFPVQVDLALVRDDGGKPVFRVATVQDITWRRVIEDSLQQSEERLRLLIEHAPVALAMFDRNMWYLAASSRWLKEFGLEGKNLVGQSHYEIFPELSERIREIHQKGLAGEVMSVEEAPFLRADGTTQWLRWEMRPWRTREGEVGGIAIFTENITERKKAEDALRIAAQAFESQEGMVVTDARANILQVNRAFTQITGYTSEELVGRNPSILQSGRQDERFYAAMWRRIEEEGYWAGELWNRKKSGEIYLEYLVISAVKDNSGKVTNYVGSMSDITQRRKYEEDIQRLALYDHLTELPNRKLLLDRLQLCMATASRNRKYGALLSMDFDDFKTINDSYGHSVGDMLLTHAAGRLLECVREGDTVSRFGGDEFVVMLEDLSQDSVKASEQALHVAEKIRTSLALPYMLGPNSFVCTSSIGVKMFMAREESPPDIVKQADIAMYQAKKAGRNMIRFFEPAMQQAVDHRRHLEDELRRGLAENELQLYYQLQVNERMEVLGAEVLLRWLHPARGMVPPSEFIPLAEETGMILPIGAWVLKTACEKIREWSKSPKMRHLMLSVNVSAKQFHQKGFVAEVRDAIETHGIEPARLKLELTESLLIEDVSGTIGIMNELKALGVSFSLDDFGTGYSSLQYLRQLPLDQLKIDQSFVKDLSVDSNAMAIVRTIIAMAKSLNLEVIAEGVETEEQKKLLFAGGCTEYQGYLFGRPVPVEEFEAVILG